MLQKNISSFITYCKHYHFSEKAIQAFTTRLNELDLFFQCYQIISLDQITYQHLKVNIAQKLPYPKIDKNDPEFLTMDELKIILSWFLLKENSFPGLRNLVIVMMFGG